MPAGPGNLALRAARLAVRHAGIEGGVHLHLTKRIPAQAGLGGGSADAAAALVAVFALYGVRVPLADRLALGAELGSDVPFALLGGTALGLGRGERLTRLRPGRRVPGGHRRSPLAGSDRGGLPARSTGRDMA